MESGTLSDEGKTHWLQIEMPINKSEAVWQCYDWFWLFKGIEELKENPILGYTLIHLELDEKIDTSLIYKLQQP